MKTRTNIDVSIHKHLKNALVQIAKSRGLTIGEMITMIEWYPTTFNRKFKDGNITIHDLIDISEKMKLALLINLIDMRTKTSLIIGNDGVQIGKNLEKKHNVVVEMFNEREPEKQYFKDQQTDKLMAMVENLMEQNKLLAGINMDLLKKFNVPDK
jgi:hypothetical protein